MQCLFHLISMQKYHLSVDLRVETNRNMYISVISVIQLCQNASNLTVLHITSQFSFIMKSDNCLQLNL